MGKEATFLADITTLKIWKKGGVWLLKLGRADSEWQDLKLDTHLDQIVQNHGDQCYEFLDFVLRVKG